MPSDIPDCDFELTADRDIYEVGGERSRCPWRGGILISPACQQVKEDPLRVLEGIIMKLQAITIAIAFAGVAGVAAAQNADQTLRPIVVSGAGVAACTPPANAAACENFHRFIRANFSPREIGMLFGNRTSYPEYLTGGYDRAQQRYQSLVQAYVASR